MSFETSSQTKHFKFSCSTCYTPEEFVLEFLDLKTVAKVKRPLYRKNTILVMRKSGPTTIRFDIIEKIIKEYRFSLLRLPKVVAIRWTVRHKCKTAALTGNGIPHHPGFITMIDHHYFLV